MGRGGRGGYEPIFQDDEEAEVGLENEGVSRTSSSAGRRRSGDRKPLAVGGGRGRDALGADDEDMWDRLG